MPSSLQTSCVVTPPTLPPGHPGEAATAAAGAAGRLPLSRCPSSGKEQQLDGHLTSAEGLGRAGHAVPEETQQYTAGPAAGQVSTVTLCLLHNGFMYYGVMMLAARCQCACCFVPLCLRHNAIVASCWHLHPYVHPYSPAHCVHTRCLFLLHYLYYRCFNFTLVLVPALYSLL